MDYSLNRREFLAGLGGLALASPAKSLPPRRIIDTHTHFYDPSRPQGVPWPGSNNKLLYHTVLPEQFREATRGLDIAGTVVVEASPWLEDNQWVLDVAKDEPLIVGFVGNLTPGTADFKSHLARFGKNRLFRGIRIRGMTLAAGIDQEAFVADIRRLSAADLEVDLLGTSAMFGDIVRLCDRAPDLRMVIDHLPFVPPADAPSLASSRTALRELGRRPQVYAKVSGVLRRSGDRVPLELAVYRKALDELWQTFGPERVIYGSNWPVSMNVAPYRAVLNIVTKYFSEKGATAMEKYFRKNSLAAYKWVKRK